MLPLLSISLIISHLPSQLLAKHVLPYSAYADFIEERGKESKGVELMDEDTAEHFLRTIDMMKKEIVSTRSLLTENYQT